MSRSEYVGPQTVFEHAAENFCRNLSQQDRTKYLSATVVDVIREIDRLQRQQADQGWLRALGRARPFIESLKRYTTVIDTFVGVKPAILSLLWGPLKLLLNLAGRSLECFEIMVKALQRIGDALPRFSMFATIYKQHPRIIHALVLFYEDILFFYRGVLDLFEAPGPSSSIDRPILRTEFTAAWKQFLKFSWSQFASQFDSLVLQIERHAALVDQEASAASFQDVHDFRLEFQAYTATEDEKLAMLDARARLCPDSYDFVLERCHAVLEDYPGTGDWLTRNKRFQDWSVGKRPVLWICGIPGSGKKFDFML